MSDKIKTSAADTPTVKVEVTTPAPGRTPADDAKDARAGRQALEASKAAANKKLEDAGLVGEQAPIVSYEHARAFGVEAPADPAEGK